MSANRTRISQLDFGVGIVRDSAPHVADERSCYDLINGLLDDDASIYKRGGTLNKSGSAFGTKGLRFLWDGNFDAGRRTIFAGPAGFGVLDDDDETPITLNSTHIMVRPRAAAQIESLLFIGDGFVYGGSRKTASFTGTLTVTQNSTNVTCTAGGFTANVDEGMLLQIESGRLYVVASVNSNTQLTLREAYEGATKTVGGTLHNLYKITTADPYEASEFYAVCANRLVLANESTLKFSPPPTTATGRPNPHSLAANDYHRFPGGVKITGIGVVGQTAIVFTTGGTWVYDGLPFAIVDEDGNPNHRVQELSRDLILVPGPGIVSFEQQLVAPCIDGIYLIDGVSQPLRISRAIDRLYRRHVGRGYSIGIPAIFRGHLLLPVLNAPGSKNRDLLVANLARPVEVNGQTAFPWSRFAGAGGKISAFAVRVDGANEPVLLGAETQSTSRIVNATSYFTPGHAFKKDADETVPEWVLVTRDYETGNLTRNQVRRIRTRAELIDAASDNPQIDVEYSAGALADETGTFWDANDWAGGAADPDDLFWSDDETLLFTDLECPMSESDGVDPHNCRVNNKARYIRFRLTNDEPCAALRLRSFELEVRPSQAVRR